MHFPPRAQCDVAYESIPRVSAPPAAGRRVARGCRGGGRGNCGALAHHWSRPLRAQVGNAGGGPEIERRRLLAYQWCLTAADDAQRRAIAERARSFAQHALELAVSPDEVADAAAALGGAHRLIGDGSPAVAALRIAADALLGAGAPDPLRAASLCGRLARFSVRGSLVARAD